MEKIKIDDCKIIYGKENMDFVKITEMLSQAFWSQNIRIDEVKKGAENSALLIGIKYKNTQVSYARVISDKTRFAYICDVYVDLNYRKNGLCKIMIDSILDNDELKDVYQWTLITKDAHKLYEKSGFKKLEKPELWMEIRNKRPERTGNPKKYTGPDYSAP